MNSANTNETLINKLLVDIYHEPKVRVNVGDHRRPKSHSRIFSRFTFRNPLRSFTFIRSHLNSYVVLDGKLIEKNTICKNYLLNNNRSYSKTITEHCDYGTNRSKIDSFKQTFFDFSIESNSQHSLKYCESNSFEQWKESMKMVVKLPEEKPFEFRRKLWLKLADNYFKTKQINWSKIKTNCFNEYLNDDDLNLDSQILKDLHRTGCDLFCGREGVKNQILLKRVLLAFARWNKKIGYCQGFNMIAAFILQAMNGDEFESFKVMVYLIDEVLPPFYFTNNLYGLSIDLIVFKCLLEKYIPKSAKHLNRIRKKESLMEPPLINLYVMQWFLTLFCNYLPQRTVLRLWDLVLLFGNDIILKTALILWENLESRILAIRNVDEFYSIMTVISKEMLEFGLIPEQELIDIVLDIDESIEKEIIELRQIHSFNINPWNANKKSEEANRLVDDKRKVALSLTNLKRECTNFVESQKHSLLPAITDTLSGYNNMIVPDDWFAKKTAIITPSNHEHVRNKESSLSSTSSSLTDLCDSPDDDDDDDDDDNDNDNEADAVDDNDQNFIASVLND